MYDPYDEFDIGQDRMTGPFHVVNFAISIAIAAIFAAILWALFGGIGQSRELYPGQFAQVDPAIRQWFRDQRVPGKGYPCCSYADGTKAEEFLGIAPPPAEYGGHNGDAAESGHWTRFVYQGNDYTVSPSIIFERKSDWIPVPDDAIIHDGKPNPMGGPVVWYYTQGAQSEVVKIRCFKPADEF